MDIFQGYTYPEYRLGLPLKMSKAISQNKSQMQAPWEKKKPYCHWKSPSHGHFLDVHQGQLSSPCKLSHMMSAVHSWKIVMNWDYDCMTSTEKAKTASISSKLYSLPWYIQPDKGKMYTKRNVCISTKATSFFTRTVMEPSSDIDSPSLLFCKFSC